MDLRLGKNAVIFKDAFCLPKKKCKNGHNIQMHLSMDIKIPSRIDACCNSHENVMVLNQNTAVH